MSELFALHDGGALVGTFREDGRGLRSFVYERAWREASDSLAVSASLPLDRPEHRAEDVDAFLWGLLPDDDAVLDRWGRAFGVSSGNPFRLLARVGEECAGALQLVTEDDRPGAAREGVAWLDEQDLAARLAAVRDDPSRTRRPTDTGRFTLAGAQPKIALVRDGDRWGVPSGRTPTTHILKPPTGALEGFAENEHLCLRIASKLGLSVARSEVRRFGPEVCIVVERFDRVPVVGGSRIAARLHQEDVCQALAIHPRSKYQNDGGPTPAQIVALARRFSTAPQEDVETFVDALALNWLLGGTDAHAKNYALLHQAQGRGRLAPLYDIASVLPYPDLDPRRAKLAMKIGGEYRLFAIRARHVRKLAAELGLDADEVIGRFRALVEAAPDAIAAAVREAAEGGLDHPVVARLGQLAIERAGSCRDVVAADQ